MALYVPSPFALSLFSIKVTDLSDVFDLPHTLSYTITFLTVVVLHL